MSTKKICPLRMAAWESDPANMLLDGLDKAASQQQNISHPVCIEGRCGFWSEMGQGEGKCAVAAIPRQLSYLTDTLHTIEEAIK